MNILTLPFPLDLERQLFEIDKRRAELSLAEFVRQAWSVIEPGQPYVHGWHIDMICAHLEAISDGVVFDDGEIYNRLLINVPPGPGWVENLVMTSNGRVRLGDIKTGDRVLTHRGRYMPVTACYSKGLLATLRVVTNSGREMVLTPDHNVLTPDGWVEAGNLRAGSVLAAVSPVDSLPHDKISPEEARLLGYLVGDGSLTQRTTGFTNKDEDVIADFELCALHLGFTTSKTWRKTHWHVWLNGGQSVRNWLAYHGLAGASSYTKFVPDSVLSSSDAVIRNFIGAYWSCDGMIEARDTKSRGSRYRASATTVSNRLATDLRHALGRIGIRSIVRAKARKLETAAQPGGIYRSFNVEVYSEADTARFIGMPGLCIRKNELAKKCKARRFDATLNEDEVILIEPAGERECMCISVEGDHSLTWDDIAVHNTMKSMLVSVFWPAWEWGPRNMPHLRILGVSHSQSIAIRDALRMRRLVMSQWYQARWGDRVQMVADQNAKTKFENTATGFRIAVAAGSITGERGDRVILDDPHSVEGASSDQQRTSTIEWFTEALPTRLNNPDRSSIVVVMQRLHEEDVSGVILDRNLGYDHIMLPMRYEPSRAAPTMLGYEDPRETEGELLFEDRFPLSVVERDERVMGPYAVAGQFQQSPTPRGGGIIKDVWWQLWDAKEYPPMEYVVASLDTAYTAKAENDPSAMTVWGVFRGENSQSFTRSVDRYGRVMETRSTFVTPGSGAEATPKVMLMYAWAERLELHELVERVNETCRRFRVDKILIENKASGHSVAQELRRLFANEDYYLQMYDPKTLDKLARLYSVQHIFAEGMVYAPDKDWSEAVIREVSTFPKGKHDDRVDTVSMAIRHMRDIGLLTRLPERMIELEESSKHGTSNLKPLYEV